MGCVRGRGISRVLSRMVSLMIENGDSNESLSSVRHVGRFKLCCQLSFPFIPSVLKPDFYLYSQQKDISSHSSTLE